MLNIGWLDGPFPKGKVSKQFLGELNKYRSYPKVQTRGFHQCPYCGEDRSSNEIRVIAKDGTIYASPMMIIHYVKDHKYNPPQDYINAVLNAIEPGSEEYENICHQIE